MWLQSPAGSLDAVELMWAVLQAQQVQGLPNQSKHLNWRARMQFHVGGELFHCQKWIFIWDDGYAHGAQIHTNVESP